MLAHGQHSSLHGGGGAGAVVARCRLPPQRPQGTPPPAPAEEDPKLRCRAKVGIVDAGAGARKGGGAMDGWPRAGLRSTSKLCRKFS